MRDKSKEADFYVAAYGSDDWSGKLDSPNEAGTDGPFATLTRARDAVRELKKRKLKGDITVYLRGGTYCFTETIVFSQQDSGSKDQKITYKAYPGETPIFTSGIHITGWKRITPDDPGWDYLPSSTRKNVYIADIPDGLGLILNLVDRNEDWLDRARIDVTDLVTTEHFKHCTMVESEMWDPPEEKKVQEYSKSMEDLSSDGSDLDLRIYNTDYNMNLLPVDSIRGNRLYTKVPSTYRLALPPPHHRSWKGEFEVCWIENLLEGLGRPGKWVCNTETNRIYLWPQSDTSEIYAPTVIEFIRVEGDIDYWGPTDTPVKYIAFDGITFTNGERAVWEEGDSGVQHDWAMADKANALLRFRGAENCTVKGCSFRKSGGVGVRFDLHAQNNMVENCLFEYLGYEAVHFCGYGIGTKDVNKNNNFVNNEIHHIGQIKWDSPAIIVWNSGYNRIYHNYLHHCPYKGVLLSAPRSRAYTKDYPMREQAWPMSRWDEISSEAHSDIIVRRERRQSTADDKVCAAYRYTRGNVVEKNTLHDISEGMWGDGIFYVTATGSSSNPPDDHNKIISNYIYNTDGCSHEVQSGFFRGVYLDSFLDTVEVHKNVWYNCTMIFEGNSFALSYGEAYPRANIFCNVSHGSDTPIVPTGRRVHPRGTLVLDNTASPQHQPSKDCLEDYYDILESLNSGSFPGDPAGVDVIKEALTQIIHDLEG